MTLSELERLAREAQASQPGPYLYDERDDGSYIVRDANGLWVMEVGEAPEIAAFTSAAHPTAILALIERCRAMERVVEAARGIDARIGFSGGRTGVRFVGPAGIQRRELLDALLALDALGKEGA